ncbi:hypothetical protein Tco_1465121 [Tanacetum coccineum]
MNPDPDDVTFEFNQLRLSPEVDDDVTFGFNQANANSKSEELMPKNDDVEGKGDDVDKESDDVEGKGDDVEDEEFTFTCLTEKTVSALEEYLRRGEEEKRKSYLPYSHIRRRPAQPRPYGMTRVLYASIKKSLRVASNILPS